MERMEDHPRHSVHQRHPKVGDDRVKQNRGYSKWSFLCARDIMRRRYRVLRKYGEREKSCCLDEYGEDAFGVKRTAIKGLAISNV